MQINRRQAMTVMGAAAGRPFSVSCDEDYYDSPSCTLDVSSPLHADRSPARWGLT